MNVDLIIKGATLISMDAERRVIEDGAIAISEEKIVAIGTAADVCAEHRSGTEIELDGHVVMPGLVDVHAHAGHGLIKTMGMHLGERWEDICGEVYTQVSPPSFWRAEARLAALERLRFGVTTGVSLLGGGDTIMRTDAPEYAAAHCEGVVNVGTRSVVAVGPTRAPHPLTYADWQDGAKRTYDVSFEEQFETSKRIANDWHNIQNGQIKVAMLYPVLRDEHERDLSAAEYELACGHTQKLFAYAQENGLVFTQDGHWRGSIRRAAKLGTLGAHALLSHCIDLHDDEIDLVVETDTKIAHNPSANASISGRCPAIELMQKGATVGLGSDATAPDRSADMFRHMQQAMHYHRRHFKDASVLPIGKTLAMCTIDGARALGLEDEIGSLEVGKKADLISIDMRKPHLTPANMPVHKVVCFANGNDVSNVFVGGAHIYKNGVAQKVDEAEIIADAEREAHLMIERIGGHKDLALPANFWTI
jgi:cytosine/adenosine deaminase-related metal-dependent hydrolase